MLTKQTKESSKNKLFIIFLIIEKCISTQNQKPRFPQSNQQSTNLASKDTLMSQNIKNDAICYGVYTNDLNKMYAIKDSIHLNASQIYTIENICSFDFGIFGQKMIPELMQFQFLDIEENQMVNVTYNQTYMIKFRSQSHNIIAMYFYVYVCNDNTIWYANENKVFSSNDGQFRNSPAFVNLGFFPGCDETLVTHQENPTNTHPESQVAENMSLFEKLMPVMNSTDLGHSDPEPRSQYVDQNVDSGCTSKLQTDLHAKSDGLKNENLETCITPQDYKTQFPLSKGDKINETINLKINNCAEGFETENITTRNDVDTSFGLCNEFSVENKKEDTTLSLPSSSTTENYEFIKTRKTSESLALLPFNCTENVCFPSIDFDEEDAKGRYQTNDQEEEEFSSHNKGEGTIKNKSMSTVCEESNSNPDSVKKIEQDHKESTIKNQTTVSNTEETHDPHLFVTKINNLDVGQQAFSNDEQVSFEMDIVNLTKTESDDTISHAESDFKNQVVNINTDCKKTNTLPLIFEENPIVLSKKTKSKRKRNNKKKRTENNNEKNEDELFNVGFKSSDVDKICTNDALKKLKVFQKIKTSGILKNELIKKNKQSTDRDTNVDLQSQLPSCSYIKNCTERTWEEDPWTLIKNLRDHFERELKIIIPSESFKHKTGNVKSSVQTEIKNLQKTLNSDESENSLQINSKKEIRELIFALYFRAFTLPRNLKILQEKVVLKTDIYDENTLNHWILEYDLEKKQYYLWNMADLDVKYISYLTLIYQKFNEEFERQKNSSEFENILYELLFLEDLIFIKKKILNFMFIDKKFIEDPRLFEIFCFEIEFNDFQKLFFRKIYDICAESCEKENKKLCDSKKYKPVTFLHDHYHNFLFFKARIIFDQIEPEIIIKHIKLENGDEIYINGTGDLYMWLVRKLKSKKLQKKAAARN